MTTEEEFRSALKECRDIFTAKLGDYSASWRILRPSSLTDQLFIKAKRIRQLETGEVAMVEEGIRPEIMALVNYGIIGLIQLQEGYVDEPDIDKKRANANKLLARFLYVAQKKFDLRLVDIQAGGLHNAIPREAGCVCSVPMSSKEQIRVEWNLFSAAVEEEYSVTERSMQFLLESEDCASEAMDKETSRRLITALQAVDNGVYAMCQDIDMVETSSNLASIRMNHETKTIDINSSQRSSIYSARVNMANTVAAVFELAGAKVNIGEGYPGWKMNPKSEILKIAVEQYKKLFGKEPKVRGIHAGLECGLFSEKYPGMDMISMGPTLRGVHSPDEKLLIPTVQMVWDHLLAIMKNVPQKN